MTTKNTGLVVQIALILFYFLIHFNFGGILVSNNAGLASFFEFGLINKYIVISIFALLIYSIACFFIKRDMTIAHNIAQILAGSMVLIYFFALIKLYNEAENDTLFAVTGSALTALTMIVFILNNTLTQKK